MSERLKFLGWRAEKKQQAARLKLKLEGLRDSLRDYLPAWEDVARLKGEQIAANAVELAATQVMYRDVLEEIAEQEREQGYAE